MINIQTIEQKFKEYIARYNPNNARVKLKIDHIQRVAKNSELIAKNLNLSPEQIQLAIAIGFFHDIGRFEQVKIANTFSDKESGINHAALGITVLFQDQLIKEFIPETRQYDTIIQKAVFNHNKTQLENDLSEEELLFCKIIRDADKLDIFYILSDEAYTMESIFWYSNFDSPEISEKIMQALQNKSSIDYSWVHTNGDVVAIFYGYLYNLYFPISKDIILQNNYLEKFTNRVLQAFLSPRIHEQVKSLFVMTTEYLKSS